MRTGNQGCREPGGGTSPLSGTGIDWAEVPEVPKSEGFLGAPPAFFLVPVKIVSGRLYRQRDFSLATTAGVTLVSIRFSLVSPSIRKGDNRPSSLTLVPHRSRFDGARGVLCEHRSG